MQLSTVSACKVIATLGLGTIATFHTQLAAATLPNLHNHTPRDQISRDALVLMRRLHLLAGASASLSSLVLVAYAASEQRGRHPYLAYIAGASFLSATESFLGTGRIMRVLAGQTFALDAIIDDVKARVYSALGWSTTSHSLDLEKGTAPSIGELNGEVVDAALSQAERMAWVGAGFTMLAFLLSAAGNLGDRY